MIGKPPNDHACLGAAIDEVIERVEARDPALATLAEQFDDPDELAAWFRTLPHRDDEGVPCDGPKVAACRPPQRLRFDALDPNCFERAARWMGSALGARNLAALCDEIELTARNWSLAEVPPLIERTRQELVRVRGALEKILHPGG